VPIEEYMPMPGEMYDETGDTGTGEGEVTDTTASPFAPADPF
jgi:hypothetical protein